MAAPPPPAPPPPAPALINSANYWRKYRGQQPAGAQQFFNAHTYQQFWRSRAHQLADQPSTFVTPGDLDAIPPDGPFTAEERPPPAGQERIAAFLADNAGLSGKHWKGIKILGEGSQAIVGLWEWQARESSGNRRGSQPTQAIGAAARTPTPTRCVIKKALNPAVAAGDLREERIIMSRLQNLPSNHLVKMLFNATQNPNPQVPGSLMTTHLYLEYCERGGLDDLITRQCNLNPQVYLLEGTLWLLFDCLINGVSAMWDGVEPVLDAAVQGAGPPPDSFTIPPRRAGWDPIIHFDIKPQNLLLHDRDFTHGKTPILKFADFGHAVFQSMYANNWAMQERLRIRGTEGFYPPEQFTERWDFNDYQTSGVAGRYDVRTAVWTIGAVMFSLATLSLEGPEPEMPFLPDWLIFLAPPKGMTFGPGLRGLGVASGNGTYSDTLIDTIFECLYEMPANRPTLAILKERCRVANNRGVDTDNYSIFDETPGDPPLSNPKIARIFPPGVLQCTWRYIPPHSKAGDDCRNGVRSGPVPPNPGPRCHHHPAATHPYRQPLVPGHPQEF